MIVEQNLQPDTSAAGQTALRLAASRRRRILIGLLAVVGVTGVMVMLSLVTRDLSDLRRCRSQLEFVRDRLGIPSETNLLPFVLPQPEDPRTALAGHYRYMPSNATLPHASSGVAVACCAKPHSMFIRESGRHVLVLEGSRYEIRWLTEAEFAATAQKLGVSELTKRP